MGCTRSNWNVLHRALDIVFDNKFLGEILDVIDGCEGASTECWLTGDTGLYGHENGRDDGATVVVSSCEAVVSMTTACYINSVKIVPNALYSAASTVQAVR